MHKLLPWRRLGLAFIVGASQRENVGEVPPGSWMIVVITSMHSDQKLDPPAAVYKVCSPALPGKDCEMGVFFCSPCASPRVRAMTNAHLPVNNCSVCHSSVGSCTQASLTSAEWDGRRTSPSCGSLRSGVTDVWPSPSFLRVKLGWALWWECISAFPSCVKVGVFLVTYCVRVTGLVSGFLSEGNHSVYSIFSASVAGEKFRSLLSCYLGDVSLEPYFP